MPVGARGRRRRARPLRQMARLRAGVPADPVRAGRGPVHPRHPRPVPADDLHQPAEVARQPPVRDRPLLRASRTTRRCSPTTSSGWRSGAPSTSAASRSRSSSWSASCSPCWSAQCTRSKKLYTTIFLIPMMIVPIVVGYNFSMIYIDSGPLNQLLAPVLERFGIDPRIRWLSDPIAAQWAIIIADIWQWTSLTFLIFLSGFSALPRQLVNAARVMGATPWQIFWRVQLPLLEAGDRHRRHHPLDGGPEDVRSGRPADLRRTRHLDPDRRLLPVGAGVGVQQVQLRRRRLDPAAGHVLGPHLLRHLRADPAAQRRSTGGPA